MGILDERADFRSGYRRREVDAELDVLVPALPAILLDGPKGVGKTSTALQRARTVWKLNRGPDQSIVEADIELALSAPSPVLLDEWQRLPALWDAVKDSVDEDPSGGRFLLTGSLPLAPTHSGAGRIASVRMRPLTLPERGVSTPSVSLAGLLTGAQEPVAGSCSMTLSDYTDMILASGFPGLQHLTGRPLQVQLDGYLERIVDSDVEEAGLRVRRPATLRAWLRAFAAATGTTASWETIRHAASPGTASPPARSTSVRYVDALSRLRVLDDLDPWIPGYGHLGRLAQGPKHHLADPALAARLVGMTRDRLLGGDSPEHQVPRDGTFLGALFESLATLSVRVFATSSRAVVSHFRLIDGRREADLIVERDDHRIVALEVKLSSTVHRADVRNLVWLKRVLGDRLLDAAVLTTGASAYRRSDGIAVVPLGLLGP